MRGACLLLTCAIACGPQVDLEDVACPPEGTTLDYESFARPFFARHCNMCHGASVEDRRGAPIAYVFDTHDQAKALERRVFARSASDNTSMPPGPDDPTLDERDDLAEWIACGSP